MDATAPPAPYILLIDDDLAIREALGMVLEDEGYQTQQAIHGRHALELLARAAPPCLILLDLMMPVMNGWELYAALRQSPALQHIPVVVISADPTIKRSAAELGAEGYLAKPVDLGLLLDTVAVFYQPAVKG
jgi:CheY-like chemotaxis protein